MAISISGYLLVDGALGSSAHEMSIKAMLKIVSRFICFSLVLGTKVGLKFSLFYSSIRLKLVNIRHFVIFVS